MSRGWGPFEANDMFSGMNAAPAIALCAYGFYMPGLTAAFCFGAGIGITIFGISYMFVHDGLVHKRFPTGSMGKVNCTAAQLDKAQAWARPDLQLTDGR